MPRRLGNSVLGAVGYLGFEVLVLWTAFLAIRAQPVPGFAVVMMAFVICALGGSFPRPASIGTIGGVAEMLIVYGVDHHPAVAAVLLHQAIGLLVPLAGGTIAYLILRRHVGPIRIREGDTSGEPAETLRRFSQPTLRPHGCDPLACGQAGWATT